MYALTNTYTHTHTHRFQLVYSCGKQIQLPCWQERATAAQALTRAAATLVAVPGSVLHTPGVCVWSTEGNRCASSELLYAHCS